MAFSFRASGRGLALGAGLLGLVAWATVGWRRQPTPATRAEPPAEVEQAIEGHPARGPLDAEGRRHGTWRISLPLGREEVGAFAAGRRNGIWLIRDADGRVRYEAQWKDGLKDGQERRFGRGGHVLARTTWVAGEAVSGEAVPVSCDCCDRATP